MSELKAFLKEIDLPEDLAENPDQLKEKFHESFVNRKIADSDPEIRTAITGKVLGSLTTLVKREFGLDPADVDGKKIEDIVTIAKSKVDARLQELEAKAKAKGNTNPDYEKQLADLQKERDTFKTMAQTKEQEFELFKSESIQKEKGLKLNFALTGLKSKIEWSETANDLAKKGFDAHLNENYKFDFDETGSLQVFDKQGNKIQNSKKTDFIGAEELLKSEAQKHGLLKMADPTPKTKTNDTAQPPVSGKYNELQPKRKLPEKAIEIASQK